MITDRSSIEDFEYIHTHKTDVLLAKQLPWMHANRSTEENFPPIGNNAVELTGYAFPTFGMVMSQSGYPVNVFGREGGIYAYENKTPNSAFIADNTGIMIPNHLLNMPTRMTYEKGSIASVQWVPIHDEQHQNLLGLCCVHSDNDHSTSMGMAIFREKGSEVNMMFAVPLSFNINTIHQGKIDRANPLSSLAPIIIAADPRMHGMGWEDYIQNNITDDAARVTATHEGVTMSLKDNNQHGFSAASMLQKDDLHAVMTLHTIKDQNFSIIFDNTSH